MHIQLMPLTVAALLLASCDGPHEEAGEKADVAAGLSDSTASLTAGPNERRGEARDAARGVAAASGGNNALAGTGR